MFNKFSFCNYWAHASSKLENLCPYPTLLLGYYVGRDQNFYVSMMYELKNRENKLSLGEGFFYSPFNSSQVQRNFLITIQLPNRWSFCKNQNINFFYWVNNTRVDLIWKIFLVAMNCQLEILNIMQMKAENIYINKVMTSEEPVRV